jgi:signal transduction histidine kinase/DNA-binding response OmpR family regulator
MTFSVRVARIVLQVCGITGLILGCVAFYSQVSQQSSLLNPRFFGQGGNITASIGFLILAASLLFASMRWNRAVLIGAILSVLTGLLTFAAHTLEPAGVDEAMFLGSWSRTLELHRIPPNAALCFFLSGIAFLFIQLKANFLLKSPLLSVIGSIVASLGLISLLASLLGVSIEPLGRFTLLATQVPPHFTLIGIGLMAFAWQSEATPPTPVPAWFPIPVGVGILVLTVILWETMNAHERALINQTIELQTTSVRNEVMSRMDFSVQALVRMVKRWETWKKPSRDMLESDVGVFVNYFTGCSLIERVDNKLNTRWSVSLARSLPQNHLQKVNEIKQNLADTRTLAAIRRHGFVIFTRTITFNERDRAFVVCIPSIQNNTLDGFTITFFDLDQLLKSILNERVAPGYSIALYDGDTMIYQRAQEGGALQESPWTRELKITLPPNIIWRVRLWPGDAELQKLSSPIPEMALIVGLTMGLLFSVVLYLAQTSHFRAQAIRKANEELEREIAERRKIEVQLEEARDAALESARLKAEFVANMSHEIRTPMNGIIGMTGLLLETDLDDQQKEYSQIIRSSSDALLNIVNDILDFSKIEAGKLSFENLDFDLNSVINGVLEIFADSIHHKKIDLAAAIAADVPMQLRGDPGRLRQVITNMVGNGVKFTEKGGVLLRVTLEEKSPTHAKLKFTIRDTGIGIDLPSQSKLFQTFSQVDNSTTRKYGGTGLGLAISRQLVQQMNGEVGVSSTHGKGSTFWFTASLEMQHPTAEAAAAKPAVPGDIRTLVVEDNAGQRQILLEQLEMLGLRGTAVATGMETIQAIEEGRTSGDPYQLLLLDLELADTDACQLASKLQGLFPGKVPPIIAYTSIHADRSPEELCAAGVFSCLRKPLKQDQLFRWIANSLSPCPTSNLKRDSNIVQFPNVEETEVRPEDKNHIRVLVAEDNAVNQKVVLRQLEKLGYSAEAVANGLEALEVLENIPYDIILMDCQMSELDGYEAAAEIRRREGKDRHTPIIALTAHALDGDRDKCLRAGMDDYLSKPVTAEDLKAALEKWGPKPRKPASAVRKKSRASSKAKTPTDKPRPIETPVVRSMTMLSPSENVGRITGDSRTPPDAIESAPTTTGPHQGEKSTPMAQSPEERRDACQEPEPKASTPPAEIDSAHAAPAEDPTGPQESPRQPKEDDAPPAKPPNPGKSAPRKITVLVDFERLKDVAGGANGEMEEMVKLYFDQADQIMKDLKNAIDKKSAKQIEALAHKGAGSSRNCGMLAVGEVFGELEASSSQNTDSRNSELFEEVSGELARTRRFLAKHLKQFTHQS